VNAAQRIGASDVSLSRICLGTMRLGNAGGVEQAAALLSAACDIGITAFHCSSEYETYPLFCAAWQAAGLGGSARVIAKVAAPHYGEDSFSPRAFRAKIDDYLSALSIPRLDVVQWLLRYDLKRDEERVRIMREAAGEIAETVAALRKEGKIGALVGFPYSAAVAEGLIAADYCDGLALYINPLEHELDPFIARSGSAGKAVVAIRPYAAGRLFTETRSTASEALTYVLSHPEVVAAVVSASSREHLDALVPFVATAAVAG